jgi:hypothetical protein
MDPNMIEDDSCEMSHGEPCIDCGRCIECGRCHCEEEFEQEPDYNYTPYEESARYREEMIDAGRGHLLR